MDSNALIGCSQCFHAIVSEICIAAPLDSTVLIQGETGTGKEVVAREIHLRSKRQDGPYIVINCAAIPASLLESELFGHERGAFTGAFDQTIGKFMAAHRGTLFLDEIGDLPLELQPKLLRVLQDQQFERLGSTKTISVDVRIIAATNLDLYTMVEEKRFRADLYYRLNVYPLTLAPLRERREDIAVLAEYFTRRFADEMGKGYVVISDPVMEVLVQYDWPGNVRELQNFIERSVIVTNGLRLTPRASELEFMRSRFNVSRGAVTDRMSLSDAERSHILSILAQTNWVVGGKHGAAAQLGLPRTTLLSRMEKLGITKASRRECRPSPSVSRRAHSSL